MGGCTDEPHRRLLLASRTPTSRRGRPMSTTQTQTTDTDIDTALKAKHRAMWALGDYHAVATEIIPALGPVLVEAAGITAGEHVLDVAAGAGNVAIPAAAAGAHVVATDLTPELLDQGRDDAAAQGVD